MLASKHSYKFGLNTSKMIIVLVNKMAKKYHFDIMKIWSNRVQNYK